jgi:hypothetical protein
MRAGSREGISGWLWLPGKCAFSFAFSARSDVRPFDSVISDRRRQAMIRLFELLRRDQQSRVVRLACSEAISSRLPAEATILGLSLMRQPEGVNDGGVPRMQFRLANVVAEI